MDLDCDQKKEKAFLLECQMIFIILFKSKREGHGKNECRIESSIIYMYCTTALITQSDAINRRSCVPDLRKKLLCHVSTFHTDCFVPG